MKELKKEEEWDRKRIIIFLILLFVLAVIGYELKRYFLDKNLNTTSPNLVKNDVKGASTQDLPSAQSIKQNNSRTTRKNQASKTYATLN